MNNKVKTPPLKGIYLYVTDCCNLKCRHCWINPDFKTKLNNFFGWHKFKPVIESAKEIGLSYVKLTGGEPFLHPEIIDFIYGIHELGLTVSAESNGTLLGAAEIKAIKETDMRLSISFDSFEARIHDDLRGVPGTFEKTMDNVENLKKQGIKFQVIASIFRKNADSLLEMLNFTKTIGASSFKINPIISIERSEKMDKSGELLSVEEIIEIYQEFEKATMDDTFPIFFDIPPAFKNLKIINRQIYNTCNILNILGVLQDGTASICGIGENFEELNFGCTFETDIKEIWRDNSTLNHLRQNLPQNLEGTCKNCIFQKYCLGRCIAQTYYRNGDFLEGYYFCNEARELGIFPESRLNSTDD